MTRLYKLRTLGQSGDLQGRKGRFLLLQNLHFIAMDGMYAGFAGSKHLPTFHGGHISPRGRTGNCSSNTDVVNAEIEGSNFDPVSCIHAIPGDKAGAETVNDTTLLVKNTKSKRKQPQDSAVIPPLGWR